jgi:hypothetical protein
VREGSWRRADFRGRRAARGHDAYARSG